MGKLRYGEINWGHTPGRLTEVGFEPRSSGSKVMHLMVPHSFHAAALQKRGSRCIIIEFPGQVWRVGSLPGRGTHLEELNLCVLGALKNVWLFHRLPSQGFSPSSSCSPRFWAQPSEPQEGGDLLKLKPQSVALSQALDTPPQPASRGRWPILSRPRCWFRDWLLEPLFWVPLMVHEQEISTRAELSGRAGIQENRRWAGWATKLGLAWSALENYRPQQPEDELRVILHP